MPNRRALEALFHSYMTSIETAARFYDLGTDIIGVIEVTPHFERVDPNETKSELKARVDVYMKVDEVEGDQLIGTYYACEHDWQELTASALVRLASLVDVAAQWNANELADLPSSTAADPRKESFSGRRRVVRHRPR